METRAMEITLISARDLGNAIMFSKTQAFAVAWISDNYKSRQWTPMDQDNGTDPTWNQVMNFVLNEADLQQGRLLLEIAIFTDTILGEKEIGRVSIPLQEFLKPAGSNKGASASPQFVTYQVRKPTGKAKGVLNLSVKLAEKTDFVQLQQPLQAAEKTDFMQTQQPLQVSARLYEAAKAEPVTAYPAGLDGAAKSEPMTAYESELHGAANAELMTAYPGYAPASSSSFPPANDPYYQGYPPPSHHGYPPPPPPPPHHGYPPPPPPPPHHGYPPPPPPPPHHGYPPPPPPHHGYPPPPPPHHGHPPYQGYPPMQQSPRKNNKSLGWLWGQA